MKVQDEVGVENMNKTHGPCICINNIIHNEHLEAGKAVRDDEKEYLAEARPIENG